MRDPQQSTGEALDDSPGVSAPDSRGAVWNGSRSRPHPQSDSGSNRIERELARHAWLSGVPLDPEERRRATDGTR